jgi:FtsZ-interacting cell division protein ZipA
MLPLIIIVIVVIPLLVLAFRAATRSKAVGERPVPEDDQTKQRTEQEFADAEAYQEQWREEEKQHPKNTIL